MIRGMRSTGWSMCALVAACHADPSTAPDAPAGDGLRVEWHADVQLPAEVAPGCSLTRAELRVSELRAISDAGSVELESRVLLWNGQVPDAMTLASAPPGLYSRLRFELEADDSDDFVYELRGTFTDRGTPRPFVIRDADEIAVSVPFSVTLSPGGEAALPIAVALGAAVAAVDFSNVELDDGVLEVEGAELAAARAALLAGFDLAR